MVGGRRWTSLILGSASSSALLNRPECDAASRPALVCADPLPGARAADRARSQGGGPCRFRSALRSAPTYRVRVLWRGDALHCSMQDSLPELRLPARLLGSLRAWMDDGHLR